jgi:polar amino acid transport system substrate-binding protein
MPDKHTENDPKSAKATGASETSQSTEQAKLKRTLDTLKQELDETYRGFSEISSELFDTASALEDSEKRLRLAAEGAGIGLWDWDIESDHLSLNASWYRLLGIDQSRQKPHWSFWQNRTHPDDVDEVSRALRKHIAGETKEFQVEHRLKNADGEWNWFLALGRMSSHGDNGSSKRLAGILLDINPRKAAEEKARLIARRFESITESAIDGILSMDSKGRIIGWNAAISDLLDYSEQEVIGQFAGLVVPEDLQDPTAEGIHRIFRGDLEKFMERVTEGQLLSKHGKVIPIEFSLAAWQTTDDNCYTAITRDITARKEAELQNERLRHGLAATGIGTWAVDIEAGTADWDDCSLAIYGLTREEFSADLGAWEKALHPEDRDETLKRLAELNSKGATTYDVEYRIVRPSGEVRNIHAEGTFERDNHENLIYHSGIHRDVTERKEAQEVIRKAREAALEAAEAKATFLASMSHEIRTPMNAVIGMADLLLESKMGDEQIKMVKTICDSGDALLTIINDILDYSKIDAGKLHIESIPLSINEVVDHVASMLHQNAVKGNVRLITYVDPEIPAQVNGDPVRIGQILLNLTSNAIKFTEHGTVWVRADLDEPSDDETSRIRFSVVDEGIGLSKKAQSGLFLPFHQAEKSTARKFGGTGLGLTICKRLSEMMEGEIGVESQKGQGSTFWVVLPFSEVPEPPPDENKIDLSNERLLFVSSDEVLRLAGQKYLAAAGADVSTSDALAQVKSLLKKAAQEKTPISAIVFADEADEVEAREMSDHLAAGQGGSKPNGIFARPLGKGAVEDDSGSRHTFMDASPMSRESLVKAVASAVGLVGGQAKVADKDRSEQPQYAGLPILLAEDNLTNQMVIKRQLGFLGYSCEIAGDGREALEAWRSRDFALILSDCNMPKMGGKEMTVVIRKEEAKTGDRMPIIAISASVSPEEMRRCLEAGMDSHLPKPVTLEMLKEKLSEWMPAAEGSDD